MQVNTAEILEPIKTIEDLGYNKLKNADVLINSQLHSYAKDNRLKLAEMYRKLIDRCIEGDRLAQKEVYEKFFGRMYVVARRYVNDHEETLEIVNFSFLKVFKKLRKFGFKGSFEGWIMKIVVNTALDHIRSNKKYKEQIRHEEDFEHTYDIEVDHKDDENIDKDKIYSMIAELPPMTRAVFNLYAIDGFSHKEIAEKLEISVGTSKWHLSAARKNLQEKLVNNFGFKTR
jgi:RNA polymerase sigma factor (sigma-70 family)